MGFSKKEQLIILREWNNTSDKVYKENLFKLVADKQIGPISALIYLITSAWSGSIIGIIVGIFKENKVVLLLDEPWQLGWDVIKPFLWKGVVIGVIIGLALWLITYRHFTWSKFLGLFEGKSYPPYLIFHLYSLLTVIEIIVIISLFIIDLFLVIPLLTQFDQIVVLIGQHLIGQKFLDIWHFIAKLPVLSHIAKHPKLLYWIVYTIIFSLIYLLGMRRFLLILLTLLITGSVLLLGISPVAGLIILFIIILSFLIPLFTWRDVLIILGMAFFLRIFPKLWGWITLLIFSGIILWIDSKSEEGINGLFSKIFSLGLYISISLNFIGKILFSTISLLLGIFIINLYCWLARLAMYKLSIPSIPDDQIITFFLHHPLKSIILITVDLTALIPLTTSVIFSVFLFPALIAPFAIFLQGFFSDSSPSHVTYLWRKRPEFEELEKTLQTDMKTFGPLINEARQRAKITDVKDLISSLKSINWEEKFVSRFALVYKGGEVIKDLISVSDSEDTSEDLINELKYIIKMITKKTEQELKSLAYHHVFCPKHPFRIEKIELSSKKLGKITFYGCRKCHQSREAIKIDKVVCVLDQNMLDKSEINDGIWKVNWLKTRSEWGLFDFDEVEIRQCDDRDVEELVMLIKNIEDKWRYRNVSFIIHDTNRLNQKVKRIIKDNFKVICPNR